MTGEPDAYAVFVKIPGQPRWKRLSDGGRVTTLKIRAIRFTSRERADAMAAGLREGNPGYGIEVRPW